MLVAGTTARDTITRVNRLPNPDQAQQADTILDTLGGCGANVATALARLGHTPNLVSAVGPGFNESDEKAALETAGVDLSHVLATDQPTARAVMTTDSHHRQLITYHEGATPAMTRLDPIESPIGHFAPGEIEAYPRLMQACDVVTYDPGQETFHRDPETVLAPLEHTDILLLNQHEADHLAEATGSLEDLTTKVQALIVTDPGGQTLHHQDETTRIPAVDARVHDPTGAGDAYSAGVVHGLANGYPLPTACRFGSVLAAFVLEDLGAQRNLPTLPRALDRYQDAYGSLDAHDDPDA